MKIIIKITAVFLLTTIGSLGKAQVSVIICAGSNTVITAVNNLGLSSPSYSMNPGGITSPNPTFAVAPASNTTYTLYVTGTNSNSAVVTTSNTVIMYVPSPPTFSLASAQAFTLGCGSTSVCSIQILNAQTTPSPGGALSYTFLAPGSSTVIPTGTLSPMTSHSVNVPGAWSVAVRDDNSQCTGWSTVNVSMNNTPPAIGSISVSQNPLTCANPTTLVQVAANPAVQYNWLPYATQGNGIIVSSNPATPTQSILALTLVVTDNNNACQSSTVIPINQNIYPPNALIYSSNSLPLGGCQHTIVLTNQSSSGIPIGAFPTNSVVAGFLWEGPSQPTLAMSSTYTAQTTGIYTMTAMDMNNGCTKAATINVIMGPLAAFVHTITGGQAIFNDISTGTGTNTTYFWDFGDGNTSTLQNPTHTYLNGGAHLVKLKILSVAPGVFCTDSVIQSVNVSGIPCSANSNFSMVPTSTPQAWNVIPSYPWNVSAASWNWGDGSVSNTLYTSHQYSAAGMYNICLSVTVSCGDTSTSCTSYSVYRTSQAAMILEVNVKAPELITGLTSVAADGQLSWNIIPNPNAGEFKLNLDNAKSESVRVVISDLTGRIVHDQSIESNSTMSIQTSNLPPGMYFVTLETGNLKTTKRMVVYH